MSPHDTLSRTLEPLKLLLGRGRGKTAEELTSELNDLGYTVNLRTVQRNLEELPGAFPVFCNDRDRPYQWRWDKDAVFELVDLSVEDALTLKVLREPHFRCSCSLR